MITIYIWLDPPGHASMKIIRAGGTRYYSWWPASAAGLFQWRGRANEESAGFGHVRRNPVSYGGSHLNTELPAGARRIEAAPHHPGGTWGYNRSDKDMEDQSADVKFYFRPCSGLDAQAATNVWARYMNKSGKGSKGDYHFLSNNCTTTVQNALQNAATRGGIKVPSGGLLKAPYRLENYCKELARTLNNNLLLWDSGIPPVVMARGKGTADRFVDPTDNRPYATFNSLKRKEPHP